METTSPRPYANRQLAGATMDEIEAAANAYARKLAVLLARGNREALHLEADRAFDAIHAEPDTESLGDMSLAELSDRKCNGLTLRNVNTLEREFGMLWVKDLARLRTADALTKKGVEADTLDTIWHAVLTEAMRRGGR